MAGLSADPRHSLSWSGWVVLCLGIGQLVLFAGFAVSAVFPLAYFDALDWISQLLGEESPATLLWQPHNEHRMVISKLIVWMDIRVFGGALYPVFAMAALGGAVIGAILIREILRAGLDRIVTLMASGVVLALLYRTFTLFAYVDGISFSFLLTPAFAVIAVWPLLGLEARHIGRLAAAMAAAVLASLTASNGLLVWLVLIWLAWHRRLPVPMIAALTLASVLVWAGYFFDHPTMGATGGLWTSFLDIGGWAVYLVHFFGQPWIQHPAISGFGLTVGAITILVGLVGCAATIARRGSGDRLRLLAVAILMFTGASGGLIALARMEEFGPMTVTRYAPYTVLAHAAVLCLVLPWLNRLWQKVRWRAWLFGAALVMALGLWAETVVVGLEIHSRAAELHKVRGALLAGDRRPELLQKIYPDPQRAEAVLNIMQAEQIYLFQNQ